MSTLEPAPTASGTARRPGVALVVGSLSKTFGPNRALDRVSLAVECGQIHALLGENGSGKSTLIKVLSGFHTPDPGGRILVGGQQLSPGSPTASAALGLRFVHQELGLVESLSVADNFAFACGYPRRWGAVRGRELHRTVAAALATVGLDVSPDRLVSTLSPAMRTGLAVARALANRRAEGPGSVLVLDEPTATLPADDVTALLDMVRNVAATGAGVLYVTHHLDEVFSLAQVATVLRDGRRVATTPVADLDRRKLVNQMVGTEFDEAHRASAALPHAAHEAVLRVDGLGAGALETFTLHARAGEVVGIAGLTGSGRESVLAAMFGAVPRACGTVEVGGVRLPSGDCRAAMDRGVAYLPADRPGQGGVMPLSAAENLTLSDLRPLWRLPSLRLRVEQEQVETWFSRLDVRPAGAGASPLATFSGGNQQKVLLAKWLRRAPVVLLLDEPTQGVDVAAKAEIHRQILRSVQAGSAAVVSSADFDELVALCHRVLVLGHGRVVAELTGSDLSTAAVTWAALATRRRAA